MENRVLKIVVGIIYLIVFLKLNDLQLENIIFFRKILYVGGGCYLLDTIIKNKFWVIVSSLLNIIVTCYIYKYTYFNYLTFLSVISLFVSFYFIISNINFQNEIIKLFLLFLLPYTIEKMVIYKFKEYLNIVTLINIFLIGLVVFKEYSKYRRKNV